MAKQLFILKNVPEQEADAVRCLLDSNKIEFYETPGGNWGISVHALWVSQDSDYERAKTVLDEYQNQLGEQARAAYLEQKKLGTQPRFWQIIKTQPVMVLIYLLAIGCVLFFSIVPFLFFK